MQSEKSSHRDSAAQPKWLSKEEMIQHVRRLTGEQVKAIALKADGKFRTGKPKYSASFYGKDKSNALFVCMASRYEIKPKSGPSFFKSSFFPHDSRDRGVEVTIVEEEVLEETVEVDAEKPHK